MNAGQATVEISGSGSGHTSGIYSQSNDGYAVINDGTLDIDVENSLGSPYGIYNAVYSGYVVNIKGGVTDIDVRRTNSESNYAGAGGIIGAQNNIYVKDGSLSVDVVNEGQDAIGITGGHFDISGGTLEVYGISSKEGMNGYGIKTDEDATFLMSGGDVSVTGNTYSYDSGIGRGIEYNNSVDTRRMDISGGTLTVTGTSEGIYVNNNTSNAPGQNQIYEDAKVTVSSPKYAIYGVRDGGWKIFGEAELTATGTERYGLTTEGPLIFDDTPVVVLETKGGSWRALYADGGITIGGLLQIADPEGGKINTENNSIVNPDNSLAKRIGIQPKDVVKINVYFYDESTLKRITNPSLMVYKDNGAGYAGGADPVRFSVGKGDDFTLTTGISTTGEYGTEYNDYEFVGWYKGGYPGTSPIGTNTTTPTQRITEDTWYYAVYAPPKTEIPALHFHVDKTPVKGQKRDTVGQTVTVDEEGITIGGTAWVQENHGHFAEDHVFTPGETVVLMVNYSVDEGYKLANDIGTNTTINGEPVSEHDTSNTVFYQQYLVPFDLEEEGIVEVTGIEDKTYTGSAVTQPLAVKYDGTKLTEGTDYTVSYKSNTYPGTATVTIKGKGDYTGTVTRTFVIKPAPTAKSFTLGGNKMNFKQNTYTGLRLPSIARPYQLSLTARFDKKMLIQWTDCKKLGAPIDGYLVMRRVGSETAYTQYVTVPATQNYYYDTGITKANQNYYYIVLAYKKDALGNYKVSSDSMSVVGLRYDSAKINPHECPAKGVSAALQAKFGLPTINKTAVTLRVGQTYDLKLTYPKLSFSTWTRWRSDKSSIAKVNSAGKVTAVSPGKVLISGRTPNGRDIRCTVTVKP